MGILEQETEQLVAIVAQRTLEGRTSVALKDLLAADIPSAVKTFFRTDVETLLLDEQRKYFKTSAFPYDHPDAESQLRQVNSVLVLHYPFNQADLRQRISDGIHLLVNYLVRPQWTLTESLFERDQTIAAASLRRLLAYFEPYEYLRSLLLFYLKEKNIESMDRRQFAEIIWKMDGEFLKRKTGDQVARLLTPLFELVAFARQEPAGTCPTRAVIRFLEDKGLGSAIPMLEGVNAQGIEQITQRELAEILEDIRRTSGAFAVEMNEQLLPPPPPPEQSATPVSPSEETAAETSPSATRPAIAIDGADERRFIRKIFNQDEQAYAGALAAIAKLNSWKEASRAIDEIFIARTIDPYSSEAVRFTERLFEHFHPRQD